MVLVAARSLASNVAVVGLCLVGEEAGAVALCCSRLRGYCTTDVAQESQVGSIGPINKPSSTTTLAQRFCACTTSATTTHGRRVLPDRARSDHVNCC